MIDTRVQKIVKMKRTLNSRAKRDKLQPKTRGNEVHKCVKKKLSKRNDSSLLGCSVTLIWSKNYDFLLLQKQTYRLTAGFSVKMYWRFCWLWVSLYEKVRLAPTNETILDSSVWQQKSDPLVEWRSKCSGWRVGLGNICNAAFPLVLVTPITSCPKWYCRYCQHGSFA